MRTTSPRRWPTSLAVLVFALPTAVAAQQAGDAASRASGPAALATWIALDAPPGRERLATDVIARALPGWHRDAIGNLVLRRGSGRPRRVVACGMDEAGYEVSEITDQGYLRVHDAGNERRSPLWDQFHEGQRVRVLTARGAIPGVFAVRSVHLTRRRAVRESVTTVDDLWVDIGAHSRAEALALGVAMLDPVARDWPRWTYGDLVAGPAAADRAGCAAVAAAATRPPATGETIFVLSAASTFGWSGVSAVVAATGDVDTLVVASSRFTPRDSAPTSAVERRPVRAPFRAIPGAQVGTTIALAVRTMFPGTLVESVRANDLDQYLAAVAAAAGVSGAPAIAALPVPAMPRVTHRDSLATAANILTTLTETYSVSQHEDAMRDAVRAELPAWARSRIEADSAGNLILSLGPDRDTVVFVAHMDEVGFDITHIAPDGTVSLRNRGGFFPSLWEGQTALLQVGTGTQRQMLRGVFVPRDSVAAKEPRELTAWFGLDSAALAARGATVGSAVTSAKTATRLAASRFTARSIDDRAGCTALLLAVRRIDPAALTHKVIFAWSVEEEIGLNGAAAIANRLRASVERVHAIDTFVSSDSPVDPPLFADAPLGRGAVVRALDNSSATAPDETARVVRLAHAERIPIQVGTTNGGNDGSEFVRFGVPDVPIGWPLRYSHSPAEVIDLADVVGLGRIVAALATH